MMVAFYFGNKSLDFLKEKKNVHDTGNGANGQVGVSMEEDGPTLQSPVSVDEARQTLASGATTDVAEDNDFEDSEAQG